MSGPLAHLAPTEDADSKGQSRRLRSMDPIEIANKKSEEAFVKDCLQPSTNWQEWKHPRTEEQYTLRLVSPASMTDEELDGCYRLVDETSGADYRGSSIGWHPAMKKTEMRSPDLRYILIENDGGEMKGFASMMPTYENGEAVVYCYEVHLKEELRGTGLGKQLMAHLTATAENIPSVTKVMLTCFVSNKAAMQFYEGLGFSIDDFSPRERKLRGGRIVTPDYALLSRPTSRLDARYS